MGAVYSLCIRYKPGGTVPSIERVRKEKHRRTMGTLNTLFRGPVTDLWACLSAKAVALSEREMV